MSGRDAGLAPPRAPLVELVARLEAAGIECALGGSGLLAALGLADTVHDWDLTTDAPLDRVQATLADLAPALHGSSGVHADHKLVVRGGEIEVIVGFAMRSEERVIRLPTLVTGRRDGVPLGSPEVWAVAYTLLGRGPRASVVFEWLALRGADPRAIERLAREPLDPELRRRLAALPIRAAS